MCHGPQPWALSGYQIILVDLIAVSCNLISNRIPGPFFFHGFLRPISRACEIEHDAFHGLILKFHRLIFKFHDVFTDKQSSAHVLWKAGPRQTSDTGKLGLRPTRAVLL